MGCASRLGALIFAMHVTAVGRARADEPVAEWNRVGTTSRESDPALPAKEVSPRPIQATVRQSAAGVELSFWASERYGMNWRFVPFLQHRLIDVPTGSLYGAVWVPFAVAAAQ